MLADYVVLVYFVIGCNIFSEALWIQESLRPSTQVEKHVLWIFFPKKLTCQVEKKLMLHKLFESVRKKTPEYPTHTTGFLSHRSLLRLKSAS